MKIFGKTASQYISFAGGVAGLVLAVGIIRLALSLAGMPNATTKWASMNVVLVLGIIYLAFRAHTTGFGTYKHLLPSVVVVNSTMHLVAIAGIVIGMITGQDNIFTTPEYALRMDDGKTLVHVGLHIAIGMIVGALINWLMSCFFLFIAKKVARSPSSRAAARA
jgi:hypothetical protein